jgi:type IV pilus assembly protein PilA
VRIAVIFKRYLKKSLLRVIGSLKEVGKLRTRSKRNNKPLTLPEIFKMRTELKAKFIQHINARRNSEKGFTLVELLVVIVIIGILTAIALPTFLNETSKAKQTEGKQNVVSTNKAQIAYRGGGGDFATTWDILAISSVTGTGATGSTTNYTYNLASNATADSATVTVTAKDGSIKGYAGAVTRKANASGQTVMPTVICEANAVGTTAPTAPTVAAGADPLCNGMKTLSI